MFALFKASDQILNATNTKLFRFSDYQYGNSQNCITKDNITVKITLLSWRRDATWRDTSVSVTPPWPSRDANVIVPWQWRDRYRDVLPFIYHGHFLVTVTVSCGFTFTVTITVTVKITVVSRDGHAVFNSFNQISNFIWGLNLGSSGRSWMNLNEFLNECSWKRNLSFRKLELSLNKFICLIENILSQ